MNQIAMSRGSVLRTGHVHVPYMFSRRSVPRISQSFYLATEKGYTARKSRYTHSSALIRDKKALDPEKPAPLSVLPTSMLSRALLVSTISSSPRHLGLCLSILSFLGRSKYAIFSPDRNPLLHWILKKTFYEHFCAGETPDEVSRTVNSLKEMGFRGVILTYAREVVVDASKATAKDDQIQESEAVETYSSDIESWRDGVMKTVEIGTKHDFLALKFTGAGASVMQALKLRSPVPQQMYDALEDVCKRAIERDVRILVDAEQQSVQGGIDDLGLQLMRKYNNKGIATVYNTYQAYLKSTSQTLEKHMAIASKEDFTLGVKLVRGAYMTSEPRHLINDTKSDTDNLYDSITAGLLRRKYLEFGVSEKFPSLDLFLGTHNRDSARNAYFAREAIVKSGQPTTRVQYGQLLGMADEVSCELLQFGSPETSGQSVGSAGEKAEVYKCLSWGTVGECVSYLSRRAAENRDAVGRTKSGNDALKQEVWRRIKAVFASR